MAERILLTVMCVLLLAAGVLLVIVVAKIIPIICFFAEMVGA